MLKNGRGLMDELWRGIDDNAKENLEQQIRHEMLPMTPLFCCVIDAFLAARVFLIELHRIAPRMVKEEGSHGLSEEKGVLSIALALPQYERKEEENLLNIISVEYEGNQFHMKQRCGKKQRKVKWDQLSYHPVEQRILHRGVGGKPALVWAASEIGRAWESWQQ